MSLGYDNKIKFKFEYMIIKILIADRTSNKFFQCKFKFFFPFIYLQQL